MPITKASSYPTYTACVESVLRASPDPLSIEELVEGIREIRPITKGARGAISRALEALYQAVPLTGQRIGWLPALLRDSVIRHTLEQEEMRGSFLLLDELEHALFFPRFFQNLEAEERILRVDLFGEEMIDAQLSARNGMWALAFSSRLAEWLDEAGAATNDDLLISVVDAEAGRYSLRVQPVEAREEEKIHQRNLEVAEAAESIAQEILHRRPLYTWQLVARLFGRSLFRNLVPPDDLHYVLDQYSRLRLTEGVGYELQLAETPADNEAGSTTIAPARPLRGVGSAPKSSASRPARSAPQATSDKTEGLGNRPFGRRVVFGPSRPISSEQGDAMKSPFEGDEPGEETCEAYDEYLAAFQDAHRNGPPLTHDDYHLLEAELESLVDLELEFGYLMADQNARKLDLAERLFIDPETLVDGNWDEGDDLDGDGPILWN